MLRLISEKITTRIGELMKKLEMNNINIGNPNISKNKLLQSVRLYNKFTTYVNVNKNVRLKRLYIFRG